MSNLLSVRRVKFQEIDAEGNNLGDPDFGILASDNEEQAFSNAYRTLEELNEAIDEAGNILDVVGGFDGVDRDKIGKDNYLGPA